MSKPCPTVSPRTIAPSDDDAWMYVYQAAKMIGCSPQTVLVKALRGEIETGRVAGQIFVSRKSVERYIAAQED